MIHKQNPPAFPCTIKNPPLTEKQFAEGFTQLAEESFSGMTLRDWFAGQALMGLAASGAFSTKCQTPVRENIQCCLEYADIMMQERSRDNS